MAAVVESVWTTRLLRKRVGERHPRSDVVIRKPEPLGHHADDAEWPVVEPHVLPDDVHAGPKMRDPELVAQQDHALVAGHDFVLREPAAQGRCYAEYPEQRR